MRIDVASLVHHVHHIVGIVSNSEMVRIYAKWIIALMHDNQRRIKITLVKKRESVRGARTFLSPFHICPYPPGTTEANQSQHPEFGSGIERSNSLFKSLWLITSAFSLISRLEELRHFRPKAPRRHSPNPQGGLREGVSESAARDLFADLCESVSHDRQSVF